MKALALFSGGLDSMLAIKIISDIGIEVKALHMNIGFASKQDLSKLLEKRALMAGAIDFALIDLRANYLKKVLFSPKYGYGKHFNPCIDCHAFMFKTALALLEQEKASFVISGEVLGQRPMSQRLEALKKVQNLAKDELDLILRPLSANLLEATKALKEGWVKKEQLFSISGRSRKTQLSLAKKYGFEDFASPGGGCLLTLEHFATKIRDLIKYKENPSVNDLELLKFGRHLRLLAGSKMIIGKNEADNENLKILKDNNYLLIDIGKIAGAFSLIEKDFKEGDLLLALRLALTYSKAKKDEYNLVLFNNKKYYLKPFSDKTSSKPFLI